MLNSKLLDAFRIHTKAKILLDKTDLFAYSTDATKEYCVPSAVVFPETESDVVEIVKFCNINHIKLIPRGAGTSQVGGVVPTHQGSIIMSFEKFDKILCDTDFDYNNGYVLVEPGIIPNELNKFLKQKGYFFPVDPGSVKVCTIGGMINHGAGGNRAVKYGITKDYILGLEVVLADGSILKTGILDNTPQRERQLDLTNIFINSEGTLGIITKAAIKIYKTPQRKKVFLSYFKNLYGFDEALRKIYMSSIEPTMLEFIDTATLKCIFDDNPALNNFALIIELVGTSRTFERREKKLQTLLKQSGAVSIEVATSEDDIEKIMEIRRSISPSIGKLGLKKINEDICVPRSKLKDILLRINKLRESFGGNILTFGHAGDGNLHVNILVNEAQEYVGKEYVVKLFKHTIDLEGVLSGEHGVGIRKKEYMNMQFEDEIIDKFQQFKGIFDKNNILNPDKIF